ncbi:B12-binding domain-containing radical SAM protein [Patescibacteria group bacterium]|nr:B12-binding domain-containing radical SAM protein [Patescibacteria group bacterium]
MEKFKKVPRFLFIHPEEENIGIEYLLASLKQNKIPVSLLYLPRLHNNIAFHFLKNKKNTSEEKVIRDKIRSYCPDVVCFSPFTSQYLWTVKQATLIKKSFPNIFILFGGVHVNSVPQYVIKERAIDGIMVGEADYQIIEFAKKLFLPRELIKVKSLWVKQKNKVYRNAIADLVSNLDSLPFADKDIFYSQVPKPLTEVTYVIMASRGCPYACSYCANNVYKKLYKGQKRLRFRSAENVVAELSQAKEKYHFRMVEFFDDVLAVDEKRLKILMDLYFKRVGLPFTCYMHPQLINGRMIEMLKKAGCCWLKLGVQSANEQYRKKYLNRWETNAQIIKVADLCHKHNLTFSLDHIFNLPGETEGNLIEAVKLYNRCRPTIINYGSLIYLPGTEIIGHGLRHGLLNKKDVEMINQGKDPVVHMSNIELFSHRYKKLNNINLSVFAMFFSLIPLVPTAVINALLRAKIYYWKKPIPQPVLVVLKVLTKVRARQLYLYFSVFKTIFYFSVKGNKTKRWR